MRREMVVSLALLFGFFSGGFATDKGPPSVEEWEPQVAALQEEIEDFLVDARTFFFRGAGAALRQGATLQQIQTLDSAFDWSTLDVPAPAVAALEIAKLRSAQVELGVLDRLLKDQEIRNGERISRRTLSLLAKQWESDHPWELFPFQGNPRGKNVVEKLVTGAYEKMEFPPTDWGQMDIHQLGARILERVHSAKNAPEMRRKPLSFVRVKVLLSWLSRVEDVLREQYMKYCRSVVVETLLDTLEVPVSQHIRPRLILTHFHQMFEISLLGAVLEGSDGDSWDPAAAAQAWETALQKLEQSPVYLEVLRACQKFKLDALLDQQREDNYAFATGPSKCAQALWENILEKARHLDGELSTPTTLEALLASARLMFPGI